MAAKYTEKVPGENENAFLEPPKRHVSWTSFIQISSLPITESLLGFLDYTRVGRLYAAGTISTSRGGCGNVIWVSSF
jgi:hypothetical protein